MDKCSSDAEFDSYWDYEAKNKNRNRIRVGRQYQATVPALLKPGEKDGRKCEELETLKWKPGQISEQEVEQYLSMAKGIGLFAKAVDHSKTPEKSENSLQSAIKGLSEFVASHHPCHHDDGCTVPKPSSSGESTSKINVNNDWSPSEAQLFAQALEACGKNFGAIKKEFLPWKPVKSIIEYYYQGKGDKSSSQNSTEDGQDHPLQIKQDEELLPPIKRDEEAMLQIKKDESVLPDIKQDIESVPQIKQDTESLPQEKQDEEPIAGCSYIEKQASVAKTEASSENHPLSKNLETEQKNDVVNFLEKRATDTCQDATDMKMSVQDQESNCASSTIGSLKFFLGGRLVLKLNARQDSGSGTKCQWVQSNDLPKHSNPTKKVKHKKKVVQDFVSSPETPQKKKRTDELTVTHRLPDYSLSAIKKPRLKSEYEYSETDKQGMLLCSSYWTPPVADGHESVDMDDASSKTSEGYVSPVLSNSRPTKGDARGDFVCNLSSVHELGEKCDSDQCSMKYSCVQSENFADDSASKNLCFVGGKNSPCQFADDTLLKQEVLNHKSALSHNKIKSPCYQPRSSHSNSPLIKQWNKWSNMPYPVKTSPSSLSPVSLVDSKSPVKEIPLDLSSKLENEMSRTCDELTVYKNCTNTECHEKSMPSEVESGPASSEFSPPSSSLGSHPRSIESPKTDVKSNSFKCSGTASADQQSLDALKNENNYYSSNKTSGDSCQIAYSCCNLPYQCSSPKCTKEYCLEDHLCNKSNPENNQESCSGYTVQDVDEGMCKKNPGWCRASFIQFYPQCYPYYLTYSISPSPGSESSGAEVPLDLSSAAESVKDKAAIPEKLSDDVNDVSQNNTEAVERGMLYQLLKNKTSK